MATRVGAAGVGDVGRLQEARRSLELELRLPVAASLKGDLKLIVACKDDDDIKKVNALNGRWSGFHIEVRPPPEPKAPKGKGKKQ